ncbi:MAG TPA: hypothetical protein VFF31_23475 [Blastocatellia bacterium]|nr:hypothetical protein [Blastocatellia bacterium]
MRDREQERIAGEKPLEPSNNTTPLTTADLASAAAVPARSRTHDDAGVAARQEEARPEEASAETAGPLFNEDESDSFRARWFAIQADFVDEPARSVEEADQLVAAVMKRLAEVFADARQNLEKEWGSGDNISTEDLRMALRRYRSFFDRLLSV